MKDRSHMPIRMVEGTGDNDKDMSYWLSRPAGERIAAVEFLREQIYYIRQGEEIPRIERVIILRDIS
jgi:hypothetical protein